MRTVSYLFCENLNSRGHVSNVTFALWESAPLKTYLFPKCKGLVLFANEILKAHTHTCLDVRGTGDREQGLTWQPNTGQIQLVTTPSQQLGQSVLLNAPLQFTQRTRELPQPDHLTGTVSNNKLHLNLIKRDNLATRIMRNMCLG